MFRYQFPNFFFRLYFLFPITSIRQTITPRIQDGHQEHLLRRGVAGDCPRLLPSYWMSLLGGRYRLDAIVRPSSGKSRAIRTLVGVLRGVKGVAGTGDGYMRHS